VEEQDALEGFLRTTAGTAGTARDFLRQNEERFVTLARESVPNLRVYERYAPQFPCLTKGIADINDEGERVFGGGQPGLHITVEFTQDQGGYRPGDEPVNGDDLGPTCFGLDGEPIRPFPIYKEATDGYCDDQEQQPGRPDRVRAGAAELAGRHPVLTCVLRRRSGRRRRRSGVRRAARRGARHRGAAVRAGGPRHGRAHGLEHCPKPLQQGPRRLRVAHGRPPVLPRQPRERVPAADRDAVPAQGVPHIGSAGHAAEQVGRLRARRHHCFPRTVAVILSDRLWIVASSLSELILRHSFIFLLSSENYRLN
jgi:hypothetical protein